MAQYSIQAGEYTSIATSSREATDVKLRLNVARSSGANWTFTGSYYVYDKQGRAKPHSFSGTLYGATGRVAARFTSPKAFADVGRIEGTFKPSTGQIQMKLWVPVDAKGRKLALVTYDCENKASKPEMETVWVLEPGYPKRCETFTEETAKSVTVDPKAGIVRWRDIPKHDGTKVNQMIKFSVPKNEYRQGEKLSWWLDASNCDHDTAVVEGLHMALGWGGQGWAFAISWERSSYGEAVGWRPTWEPIFGPPQNARVRFVVRKPEDLYEWWYAPVTRPKKPAEKPAVKPADKPTGAGGTTGKPGDDKGAIAATPGPKGPTLKVVSMKGDVQVRKNNTLEWVDFKDALPLKVGDQISTGPEEEIEIALPDGATLRMEPGSTIKVGPLLQANGQRTQAIMDMIAGRVFVRGSSRPGFAGGDFVLRRNETGVSPRGTEFSVAFDDKSKMMQVHVDEGEVTITNKGEQPIDLKAGETWVRQYLDGN